jgi:Transposase and inactivated derivatives
MQDTDKNIGFVEALLEERDHLYRETVKLKDQLNELSDAAAYQEKIQNLTQENASLKSRIEYLQRKLWGKSSEKYIAQDPLQRKLDFDGLEVLPQEQVLAEAAAEEITEYKTVKVVKKEKKQAVRKPLPEDLPRVEEHIYPEGVDTESGKWVELAPQVSEILEIEPSKFYVRRIIRHTYVLKDTAETVSCSVVTAPMPALPIAKSYAGSSVLAELIVNKYVHHLPFYRQIQIFKQQGVGIPASTINDWFKETADLLRPMYYRLKELVLSSDYIQVDETTLPIVDNEKHKTVKSYLWMVRAVMENIVFFHYDYGSRAQKVAIELLKDFKGALQTDGYEVYAIYENKHGVLPIGCWAHARRKFEEALKEDEPRAGYALGQIGLLYDVERMADQEDLSYEDRAKLRSRLAYPIMCIFEKWILKEYPKVFAKGRIGRALRYTYTIFHRLSRYHLDGRYRIDNNLGENAIRPIALGRKNYLFCGNHEAAENAAVFYSLLGCCKAADVNFKEWMIDVLNHIHEYDNDYNRDLIELLPAQWKVVKGKEATL